MVVSSRKVLKCIYTFFVSTVPPSSLQMTQDGTSVDTLTVVVGTQSVIVCTALGARPAVSIEWYHRIGTGTETQITSAAAEEITENGDTSDTVSTLSYDISREYNGGQIKCVTSGQQVAERREDTAVLNVQCELYFTRKNLQFVYTLLYFTLLFFFFVQ